jgi:nicotinamidase-related amidase
MEKKIKVLVLIDVQNDFIDGALSNENAQKVIPNIVEKIKNFDGDAIFYTLDTHFNEETLKKTSILKNHFKNYLESKEGEKLPIEHCIIGTNGWELNSEIKKCLYERLDNGLKVVEIYKPTFGSVCRVVGDGGYSDITLVENIFELEQGTEKQIPMEIEMCGFCTDICVVSNALILKAFTYDFAEITVDSSCCAGVTPEKHEAALDVMRSCQINVI